MRLTVALGYAFPRAGYVHTLMKPIKKILAGTLTILMAVAMTLGAMFVLVRATLAVAQMANPMAQALAVGVEIVLGVILLVGTVYLATRLAVRIFGKPVRTANEGQTSKPSSR